MRSRLLPLLLFSIVASILPGALADSVLLKNGTEIKGEIISDGPEGVLIEYYATATIKDQKCFKKEEVAKVVTVAEDERAFGELSNIKAPATALDTSFYDSLVDKKIPAFIKVYPYSSHLASLRETLRALDEERSRIRSGDRKIDGVWITSAQIAADPYNSGARIKYTEMKLAAGNDDPVASLQAYELLEKNYPGAAQMPDALDLAMKELDQLQAKISMDKANLAVTDINRQKAIAAAQPDQAKIMKDAMAKEDLAAKTAGKAATLDGSKFFTIYPNNKEALDALQAVVTGERTRLALLQKTPMREGLVASKEASRMVASRNLKEATDQLISAEKLWPQNAEIVNLRKEVEELSKAPTPAPSVPAKS